MELVARKVLGVSAYLLINASVMFSNGCSPQSVDAVPRKSIHQPVFGAGSKVVLDKRSNDLDLGFFHDDLFACFTVDVPKLVSNPDMEDIPWENLEEQLAALIGRDNSKLERIQRAWFLLDRDSFTIDPGGKQESPMVLVLDFNRINNEDQLIETSQSSTTGDAPNSAGIEFSNQIIEIKRIGENRIVVGNPSLIAKFSSNRSESTFSRQLMQMKLDSDIDGLIDVRPIRSPLQQMFDIAARLGGRSMAKFARIPEVTQRAELSLSFCSEEMFEAVVYIDDDELTDEIARMVDEASSAGGSGTDAQGLLPLGLGLGGTEFQTMISPTSSKWVTEIGKQIADEDLFSASGKKGKVVLKLSRPNKVKQLIAAILHDVRQQFRLARRINNLETIARAMKTFQEQFGCLPPAGVVRGQVDGIPDQFNWRVGLLPLLNEQELYASFDFNQPWDSPKNLEVASQMPCLFASGDVEPGQEATTRFHVIGGTTGYYKTELPKLEDVSDKKIWTAIVIEGAPVTSVPWTKPGPLNIESASLEQFGHEDENGILFFNAAFATRIIKKDLEMVRGILTTDGGETFRRTDFLPLVPGQ